MNVSLRSPQCYRQQRGQVLVLGMLFLALVIMSLVYAFQSTRLLQTKTHLVATVDAAVYSAALLQARAFNMHAYINRAQVAHHVAMGHMVTLASWAKFGDRQAKQLARANPPAWTLTSFFGSYGQAYARASLAAGMEGQFVAPQVGQLALAFMEHDRVVNHSLHQAQMTVMYDLISDRDKLVNDVLRANHYEAGQLHWSWLEDGLRGYVERKDASKDSAVHDMVMSASAYYNFLSPRDATVSSLMPVDERCPLWRHELRRQGKTSLSRQGVWDAYDSLSWHALRSNRWIGCYYREYPMGYAELKNQPMSIAGDMRDAPSDFSQEDFWRWALGNTSWNIFGGTTNPLANSWAKQQRTQWSSKGYADYVDLTNSTQSLALTLYTKHAQPQAQSHALGLKRMATKLRAQTEAADLQTQHASRAQTYYREPLVYRLTAMQGNLFQPFWQAQLLPLDPSFQRPKLVMGD